MFRHALSRATTTLQTRREALLFSQASRLNSRPCINSTPFAAVGVAALSTASAAKATATVAEGVNERTHHATRSAFETLAGMTHAPFLPKSLPCPYLASKQLLGGAAHVALAAAPIVELPLRVVHLPLTLLGPPSALCPHLFVKSQLQALADAAGDANLRNK
mmetsp:Transcript_18691/g.46703  ORF Transcript_18691/g.46703 Transcript_18691/m.46703 type:complete len:162 (+) Transcript_18691:177-662(+)|eukprot:CAMPEP_0178995358 /NCGR_PEP_ID=MMETSP0795-20121207/7788_1 /TAXON_ID=88552 /ORGANISM="Amoebophrya sp., Strain Ameob2" /LENGTH=161 /DNA_ID=CAMNT_0020687667 /DNA_START=167 /DNA_END=652 /DNA_ORIENTATION=-